MVTATHSETHQRKLDHIEINLDGDVDKRSASSGFSHFRFVHNALPEISLHDIDTSTEFLGKRLALPLLISSMSGGVERGWELTRRLARVAQAQGCAIGVGSQRAAIEDPGRAHYFHVRDVAPDVLLLANLGAVQLNYGFGPDECRQAVEMIDADALILHLNPVQEALQFEGNCDFSGLAPKIEHICRALPVPVVVKEVGFGISTETARRLKDCGVAAIDVAGSGGTSWSAVEHLRAPDDQFRRLSHTFVDWGIPTPISLRMAAIGAPGVPLIASGGLSTGVDIAKAIALGATLGGIAGPLLRAANKSEDAAFQAVETLIDEFRLALFGTGSSNPGALTPDLLIDIHQVDGMERFDSDSNGRRP